MASGEGVSDFAIVVSIGSGGLLGGVLLLSVWAWCGVVLVGLSCLVGSDRAGAGVVSEVGAGAGVLLCWVVPVLSSSLLLFSSLVVVENDISIIGWGFLFFELRGCCVRAWTGVESDCELVSLLLGE